MTNAEKKMRFIQLRGEGESFSSISKELGVSKSTCSRWNKEFQSQIEEETAASLDELGKQYNATREARLKAIGETLEKIELAIADIDFSEIAPERLLDLKLKYLRAIRGEYIQQPTEKIGCDMKTEDIIKALAALRGALQRGEIEQDRAKKEQEILSTMLKAVRVKDCAW